MTSQEIAVVMLEMGHIKEAIPKLISAAMVLDPHCLEKIVGEGRRTLIRRKEMPSKRVCHDCNVARITCPMLSVWENPVNLQIIDSKLQKDIIIR